MGDSTADVEFSLHNDVQALLKEINSGQSSQKGKVRWTLEKKVETDPSCSVSLIQVLVKELEKKLKRIDKIDKTRSYNHVIPLLHTLYYVVIQSGSMIPTSVYQSVNQCLMKILVLPLPYSAVAQSTLRSIKMEMNTPGSLYQRRVTAEQNLKNEQVSSVEKVFVLADPAVFSAPLEATVRAYLEVSNMFRDTPTMEKNLVLRVLQKGLGTACQSSRLAQALEALGDQMLEQYFQEVVVAMEQSIKDGAGGGATYLNRLKDIHRDILSAGREGITVGGQSSVCCTAMPFPEISFYLWKDEEHLGKLLENFTLPSSSSVDEEEKNNRDSVLSEDSGIVRDLKSEADDTEQPPVSNPGPARRRNAMRGMNSANTVSLKDEKVDAFPYLKEDRKQFTARVVVMGDDRVLGRLSRAYRSILERESEHLILSKKLNLQLYYIPVTAEEPLESSPDSPHQDDRRLSLALLLGRVDPWYDRNINSLGATISKLPVMQSMYRESRGLNLYLLDTLCYYLRCGTQPVNLPVYRVKMIRSSQDGTYVEQDVFVSQLEADIPEFRHLKQKPEEASKRRPRRKTVGVFGGVVTVSYTATCLSKREVTKGEAPMTCGVVITSELAATNTGEDFLSVRFDCMSPEENTKIQTQNISIKTMEERTLSVCLDRDARRTYTNIQRIEVSPCSYPRNTSPLSQYLDTVLSLPISTFSGETS